jgi:F-type H+-transporting ATPase subunit a
LNGIEQAGAVASEFAHFTWLNIIPGFNELDASLGARLGNTYWMDVPVSTVRHVFLALLMTAVVLVLTRFASRRFRDPEKALVPEEYLSSRNFFEIILDALYGASEDAMGAKYARRVLPLVATITIYVFFSNILGLIPGMAPPTENLNNTLAPAIVVFIATHYYGIREQGPGKYLVHMFGPVWYIAPLFFVIEIFSHIFRVVSLSFRLMGNMIGDHTVIASFLGLTAIAWIIPYPLPFYILGLIVCTVQTLVFAMLTIVYIQMAVAHEEH